MILKPNPKPLAMTARRILEGAFNKPGVQLPIHPEIYNPVLKELEEYQIRFVEEDVKSYPNIKPPKPES